MAKKKGNKKKGRILIFLCSILFAAIGITIAYAANTINTATNVVTIGNVKIELINEDKDSVNLYSKEPGFKNEEVIPGEEIPKIVRVKNTGDYAACIRLKVKKEWGWRDNIDSSKPTPDPKTISTSAIVLKYNDTMWKLGEGGKGEDQDYEYYYYQEYVRAGDEINFMDNFYVDSNQLENEQMSPNVMGTIKVVAEAVQADYYGYKYDEETKEYVPTEKLKRNAAGEVIGWNNVTFEPGYTNDVPNSQVATGGAVTGSAVTAGAVNFVGDTGKFVSFPDGDPDLFINIKGILPGETRQQPIDIMNSENNQILRVYMRSSVNEWELSDTEKDLLKKLQIRITKWDKNFEKTENTKKMSAMSLSSGNTGMKKQALQRTIEPLKPTEWQSLFDSAASGNYIFLGEFQPGDREQLNVEIKLSEDWAHSYCKTSVNWTFITEKDLITPPPYNPSRPNPTFSPTPEPSEEPELTPPTQEPKPALPTKEPVVIETPESTDRPNNGDAPTDSPELTPEPTPIPTSPPILTPEPTLEPTPFEPTIAPTPSDSELGGNDNPMANPSVEPVPSKTPKPTQKPKKTEKPLAPEITLQPEETMDGNIPKIDVTPDLPEESATKTGDDTPVFFWGMVCFVSLFGVLYNGIVLGKRKE